MKNRVRCGTLTLVAIAAEVLTLGASEPDQEIWSSEWMQVTDRNGVWDEYYARTPDGTDCSFSFRVFRTADRIGVEAYVRDDAVVTDDCKPGDDPCTTWKDDCLEVFFDGDGDGNPNTRGPDPDRPLPCNAGGEYAIAANGATQSDYASAKKCFGRLWGGTAERWTEANGTAMGTHYKLWFDWACLGRTAPPADRAVRLKMTVCVHDDDDGGACDHALYWKGNPKIPYADESAFGEVELKGGASDATTLTGAEFWGGRRRHPAVVNAWGTAPSDTLISLRGEWDFGTRWHDASAATISGVDAFLDRKPRKVRVPGCWETSGVGEPGLGRVHLAEDNGRKGVRHVFAGKGFYRRRVTIPESWRGKRVWLKVGGVRSVGWFFVNGKAAGLVDTYAGAWKYDVTDCVTPGEVASVVAVVDNVVGSRNTQCDSANKWGGLVRDVELEATPQTCIDDAWVRGDFDARTAEAHVRVDGGTGFAGRAVRVTVDGRSAETAVTAANAEDVRVTLPLAAFRPWSPADPHLYVARIELLEGGRPVQTRVERFGVRKLEVVGREFRLNGSPFYFRGYGDDSSYPITGVSPAVREAHLEHLLRARAAGFNYVRLHTHCEVPEFFEAADEAGIMVQPELSYYGDNPMDHFSYDPIRDATDRWVAFRRHPSWAVACSGNEGFLGARAGEAMYAFLKRIDPDRLVQEEDGRGGLKSDHEGDGRREDFRTGPLSAWWPGSWDPPAPFVCHEYLNLCVKQDSRLEKDFTGAWLPPATRADRAATLAKAGLTHAWGDRLQDAQHAAQKLFQKLGIETARRDPQCDGYCYWTVADVAVYNEKLGFYTAQGWLDPFWRVKRCGATERDFAVFNSPSCLLLDLERLPLAPAGNEKMGGGWGSGRFAESNRVYASGQTIDARFLLAHFESEPLKAPELSWRLEGEDGTVFAKGTRRLGDQALGCARPVADVAIRVPELVRPTKARLAAEVAGIANSWDFWLFPKRGEVSAKGVWFAPAFASVAARYVDAARAPGEARVTVAAEGSSEALAAEREGRALLTLSGWDGEPNHRLGWWWIGKQTGTAFVRHPAWGDFPYEPFLAPLHFRLIRTGTALPAAGVTEAGLIAAGEGGDAFYAYLAEEKTSRGARKLRVSGLDLVSDTVEGAALLDRLLAYLRQ